nr:replication protein A 70 kDa DNA-binding subunit B [Tanacetum cinerariifolium]
GVQYVIVGTMIAIQEDEGLVDETGTMSLSLFNDEVKAMSEYDGSIPMKITNLIGNKYAFMVAIDDYNVAIDDYNVKKLLPIFIVLRFSNDQKIINSVLACATPTKDLESQTDENTTPKEKQKTNKRPTEGEPRSVFN